VGNGRVGDSRGTGLLGSGCVADRLLGPGLRDVLGVPGLCPFALSVARPLLRCRRSVVRLLPRLQRGVALA
jgi:hypothetical protein